MTGREILTRLPTETERIRDVRHAEDDVFDGLDAKELGHAARWMRAASYSALEGARKLERLARERQETTP